MNGITFYSLLLKTHSSNYFCMICLNHGNMNIEELTNSQNSASSVTVSGWSGYRRDNFHQ